jgi:hypothetical protein
MVIIHQGELLDSLREKQKARSYIASSELKKAQKSFSIYSEGFVLKMLSQNQVETPKRVV